VRNSLVLVFENSAKKRLLKYTTSMNNTGVIVINFNTKSAGVRISRNVKRTLEDLHYHVVLIENSNRKLDEKIGFTSGEYSGGNFLKDIALSLKNTFSVLAQIYNLQLDFGECKDKIVIIPMHHYLDPILFARLSLLRRSNGFKLVIWMHDVQAHPGDNRFINFIMVKSALLFGDIFVVLSENVKKRLSAVTNKAICSIVHPLDTKQELFNLDKKQRDTYDGGNGVLFLLYGRLKRYKGLERLRDAWDEYIELYPDSRLRIIGNGDRSWIESLFSASLNCFLEIGFISDQKLVEAIKSADIVVLPYSEASQSGVIPECATFRKPYVITPLEGLVEQLSTYGGGVQAADFSSSSFADSMKRVTNLTDFPSFNSLELFSWKSQMEIMLKEITKQLGS